MLSNARGLLVATVDRYEEMAAFDKLPKAVRMRLDYALFEISPGEVLACIQAHGVRRALRDIAETERVIASRWPS